MSDTGRHVSLHDRAHRNTPAPEAPLPLPRQRNPLDDPNPWVRMAYHEGIDWARQQREGRAPSVDWQAPVGEWAHWCEAYYLSIMRGYGWEPDPGGSVHLTPQQKEVGDGASKGLALATEHLYPYARTSPERTPQHAPPEDHP